MKSIAKLLSQILVGFCIPRLAWAFHAVSRPVVAKRPSNFSRQSSHSVQTVSPSQRNRVAVDRATEIGKILLFEVFLPVVGSVAVSPLKKNKNGSFWAIVDKDGITNAERVCNTLEALGPTYVKFGQALASRVDIIPQSLANALLRLQDSMAEFPTETAKEIIRTELSQTGVLTSDNIFALLESLSKDPVAAASIGQVYKGYIEGIGEVAVKVKRPGIDALVESDAALLKAAAGWVESLPSWKSERLIAARLVNSVDEFMARIVEELDYSKEVSNMISFGNLYSSKRGTCKASKVVVPDPLLDYCSSNVIVMEWVKGVKLEIINTTDPAIRAQNLEVVQMGIASVLSQLLETGTLHADPHLGNLQRVDTPNGPLLGYLDFGLLADVPQSVRDGIVCAVVQLVFARNVSAVAALFGELQLLPPEVISSKKEMADLTDSLDRVFSVVLEFPDSQEEGENVPTIRFDNLLGALFQLTARFQLSLPPYFLNNARALATLEGVAMRLDPSFNVLRVVYPFALDRLLRNPNLSTTVADTTLDLLRDSETGLVRLSKGFEILKETARLTGRSKRKVAVDVISTRGGRQTLRRAARISFLQQVTTLKGRKGRIFSKVLNSFSF